MTRLVRRVCGKARDWGVSSHPTNDDGNGGDPGAAVAVSGTAHGPHALPRGPLRTRPMPAAHGRGHGRQRNRRRTLSRPSFSRFAKRSRSPGKPRSFWIPYHLVNRARHPGIGNRRPRNPALPIRQTRRIPKRLFLTRQTPKRQLHPPAAPASRASPENPARRKPRPRPSTRRRPCRRPSTRLSGKPWPGRNRSPSTART